MKLSELQESAKLLECRVLTSLEFKNSKLRALFDIATGRRCSPFYSLAEWEGKSIAKVVLDYLKRV